MSAYSDRVIADGAVAYWRLGETSGTVANDSVGTAHGTISGGVTLNQPGALTDGNAAMVLDGLTGMVTVPNGSYLAVGAGPLTVELWFKTSAAVFPLDSNWFALGATNGSGIGPGFDLLVWANNHWSFSIGNGTAIAECHVSGGSWTDGAWHHFVGVVTRGATDQVHLYIDGVLLRVVPVPATGWNITSSAALAIGTYATTDVSSNRHFNGSLDEVAIYNTALTPTQIAAHYATATARPLSYLEVDMQSTGFSKVAAVTPHDTNPMNFGMTQKALWVGGAGNLAVIPVGQNTAITLTGIVAGSFIPLSVKRVMGTNTTATLITALGD